MIVFALDTETTGLIENQTIKIDKLPEIIEFYGCLVDLATGELMHDYEALIKPKGKLNTEETNLTTITEEMLADKQPFSAHAETIKKLIEGAPAVMAHNLAYDKEMIDIEMKRCGTTIKWPRSICTVEQTVHLKGFRLNLTGMHELLFGSPFPDAHRAKPDASAMVRCAIELYKRGEL